MNFVQFKTALSHFPVFSVEDARAMAGDFDRRRLTEWQAKGYLRKIAKGCYVFADVALDESILFRVANRLYRPSYVSLEAALVHYGLIPETAYGVTSVTTRRTYRFDTWLTHFSYRTVAKRLFFGYHLRPDRVKMATPEKAILDFLYLNPHLTQRADFDSLRVDRDAFQQQVDQAQLLRHLGRFDKKSLTRRARRFLECMGDA